MSAVETAKQAAEKLPRLTDDQVARIAALLSLAVRRRVIESRGGGS